MRALVTRPGSGRAWAADIAEPALEREDEVVLEMLRIGVCGTDRHVMDLGNPARSLPAGDDYLVIGHEAVGRVLHAGPAAGLEVGSLVVPTVRRGCGECRACAVNQADLCFTGKTKERGIVGLHGFLTERIVERAEHLVPVPDAFNEVGPLVESLTTPEKALRRIANARAHLPQANEPLNGVQRALVTGSGPIALLAVMALRLRDIPTWTLARQPADGPAARLVEQTGATYVLLSDVDLEQPQTKLGAFDAIIEATGAAEMSVAMLSALGQNGVLDLVGGAAERKPVPIQAAALGAMVGRNLTLLGSVNANLDDWHIAVRDLAAMRTRFPGAVEALITHTFGMGDFDVAFDRVPGQIKAIVDVAQA